MAMAHPPHYYNGTVMTVTTTITTCSCGNSYITEPGRTRCYTCAAPKPPITLRDECGACGQPCSGDWCPFCEGLNEGESMAHSAQQALVFQTQQAQMLRDQLAHRDRLIGHLRETREKLFAETSTLKNRQTLLEEERDNMRRWRDYWRDQCSEWQTRYIALRTQQERLRSTARRTLKRGLTLAAGASLAVGIHLAAPWPPPPSGTWPAVAALLVGLLLGMRHKSYSVPTRSLTRAGPE